MRKSTSSSISEIIVPPPGPRPGTRELGPSDLSDTGSDTIGAGNIDDDSDSAGTGEGRDAGGGRVDEGADLNPDHIVVNEDLGSPGEEE